MNNQNNPFEVGNKKDSDFSFQDQVNQSQYQEVPEKPKYEEPKVNHKQAQNAQKASHIPTYEPKFKESELTAANIIKIIIVSMLILYKLFS